MSMSKIKNKKYLTLAIVVFAIAISTILMIPSSGKFLKKYVSSSPELSLKDIKYHEFTATKDGQSALELIENNADVEEKQFDFGVMIVAIDGLRADKNHFWAFYVNDKFAEKGVADTVLKKGDRVKMVYKAIK